MTNSDLNKSSLKLILLEFNIWFKYFLSKWKSLLLIGFIGGGIGLLISFLVSPKYVSRVSFVVEDSKAGGGAGIAALAGQFGFDIGGIGGGGLFSGDNVLIFLKSEKLCREVLMTPYGQNTNFVLADKYAEVTRLKSKWRSLKKIGEINFSKFQNKQLPRLEDSLLQEIIRKEILETDLLIFKPDKKASFIEVRVTMKDELLSKLFSDRLVKIATQRYIESKNKVRVLNVEILQRRADSLASILNDKVYISASTSQSLIDINPALKSALVGSEILARDKTMVSTIFAEVVKNLEISKTILSQFTPVIQIVDESTLPLEVKKFRKLTTSCLTSLFIVLAYMVYLFIIKWWKSHE
jgi:hypothetical protein